MNYKLRTINDKFLLKTLILVAIFVINFCFIQKVLAVNLILKTEKETIFLKEQFFVDIYLSPEKNEEVNAFDVSVSYSSNLTFLGSENGSSVVSLWVEKPNMKEGSVDFAGIIPGGFKGVVDPMNPNSINDKKPGLITRLSFAGNNVGKAYIDFDQQTVLANDGFGSILGTSSNNLSINISKGISASTIKTKDDTPPENFEITLSQNPLIFDGKYFILFEAKDKESGVDYYEIKEENRDWQKGESPYLILNQPPVGTIFVKAVDYFGNSTTEELTPHIKTKQTFLYPKWYIVFLIFVFILIICILIIYKKRKKTS